MLGSARPNRPLAVFAALLGCMGSLTQLFVLNHHRSQLFLKMWAVWLGVLIGVALTASLRARQRAEDLGR